MTRRVHRDRGVGGEVCDAPGPRCHLTFHRHRQLSQTSVDQCAGIASFGTHRVPDAGGIRANFVTLEWEKLCVVNRPLLPIINGLLPC